jgi:wyosine [tRNA(Phe)-imidazoG37] synthetase (radical SAM superfamily)
VPEDPEKLKAAWRRHERRWADNRYVYAVVSRRSGGLSVGINLNPDKACNFDCIYCQVDRTVPPTVRRVDLRLLGTELDLLLSAARDGRLFDDPRFDALPPPQHFVRDIAFSGDGEPTTSPHFPAAVRMAADARRRFELVDTKLVLITDAAYLTKPSVRTALVTLDENNGEIWAKLDAGTEAFFRRVNKPNVPFRVVLGNITAAAIVRPIVIQSLWMRIDGGGPPAAEVEAFCDRLNEVLEAGGRLKAIQLYTIARTPASPTVSALSDDELNSIAAVVRARVTAPVEVYYGVEDPPTIQSSLAARRSERPPSS